MNTRIYQLGGRFKSLLFVFALLIVILLLLYTHDLVQDLRQETREIADLHARYYALAAEEASGPELNFIFEKIIQPTKFPIIQSDADFQPSSWKGIGVDPNDRSEQALKKVRNIMAAMRTENEPIPISYQGYPLGYLFFGDSKSILQLQRLPYVTIAAIGLFITVGFLGFNSIRRGEQRFIWVGMAKETAHQLGTPISSLMGWLELLKIKKTTPEQAVVLDDMQHDVKRLDKVAQRFSRIGSKPDIKPHDLGATIENVVVYFRRRIPQNGKSVTIDFDNQIANNVPFNPELLEWVIENLVKNSLDAIDKPSGKITVRAAPPDDPKRHAVIDIIDTGKGIENSARKNVFKPGFSTKKRGWGLGLSLVRRIVEEYHGGKLILKETEVGKGTTIRVVI